MGRNLNNHTLHIDSYMKKMLYINQTIITNQNPVTDMQEIHRKEFKYITQESLHQKRQLKWEKRAGEERDGEKLLKQL